MICKPEKINLQKLINVHDFFKQSKEAMLVAEQHECDVNILAGPLQGIFFCCCIEYGSRGIFIESLPGA